MKLPGKSKKAAPAPPLPVIEEPAVIPDPDDKALKVVHRRKVALRSQRSGRRSTINTAPTSTVLG